MKSLTPKRRAASRKYVFFPDERRVLQLGIRRSVTARRRRQDQISLLRLTLSTAQWRRRQDNGDPGLTLRRIPGASASGPALGGSRDSRLAGQLGIAGACSMAKLGSVASRRSRPETRPAVTKRALCCAATRALVGVVADRDPRWPRSWQCRALAGAGPPPSLLCASRQQLRFAWSMASCLALATLAVCALMPSLRAGRSISMRE